MVDLSLPAVAVATLLKVALREVLTLTASISLSSEMAQEEEESRVEISSTGAIRWLPIRYLG